MIITIKQVEQTELAQNAVPHIEAPRQILPSLDTDFSPNDLPVFPSFVLPVIQRRRNCCLNTCFDYSRCSVTSLFPVFVYRESQIPGLDEFVKKSVTGALGKNVHVTSDPAIACIYIVLVGKNS